MGKSKPGATGHYTGLTQPMFYLLLFLLSRAALLFFSSVVLGTKRVEPTSRRLKTGRGRGAGTRARTMRVISLESSLGLFSVKWSRWSAIHVNATHRTPVSAPALMALRTTKSVPRTKSLELVHLITPYHIAFRCEYGGRRGRRERQEKK